MNSKKEKKKKSYAVFSRQCFAILKVCQTYSRLLSRMVCARRKFILLFRTSQNFKKESKANIPVSWIVVIRWERTFINKHVDNVYSSLTYVKRRHLKLSNIHQEGQANDLQQQQQLNNTLLMLIREETYQTFQPAKNKIISNFENQWTVGNLA